MAAAGARQPAEAMEGLAFLVYPAIGVLSGTLAGLFGVGGGVVIVPALNFLFILWHTPVPEEARMHFAVGSSLGVIVFTSLSSLRAHHRRGAVLWPAVRRLTPGIVAGGMLGAAIASALSNGALQSTFGVFVILIALYIVVGYRPAGSRPLPRAAGAFAAGVVIGSVAALGGIGGGILTVPFLLWCTVPLRHAVGTAAACTFPVALAGAVGFVVMGWKLAGAPALATGFLYWPAIAGIAAGSVLAAPLGAWLAHTLPVEHLRRAFAVLLILVGLRMLLG